MFKGGGETGQLIRELDWSRSELGHESTWPQSLKTAVSIMLASKFPMMVHWGKSLIHFYNDGYAVILQNKHPGALGEPAYPWWSEIWDMLQPIFNQVWAGETTYFQNQLVLPNRRGFVEEAYFTFSHSPIYTETGEVGGIMATALETTVEVVSQRRLSLVSHISSIASEQGDLESVCKAMATSLGSNPQDVPFALLYLLDEAAPGARLAFEVGGLEKELSAPVALSSEFTDSEVPWPLLEATKTAAPLLIDLPETQFGQLPGGAWPEPARQAVLMPLPKPGQREEELPLGVLICGISPRRPYDEAYQTFLSLVAELVVKVIHNANAREEERKRIRALAELNEAKNAFFSNISHEFRTPLTLMLGPLEELLAQDNLEETTRTQLVPVLRNAQRLKRQVNDLLKFNQINEGKLRAEFRPVNITALTKELSACFQSAIERAGLAFEVSCSDITEPVYVDSYLYESILFNLLSNALKFTFTGKISVVLQRQEKNVLLQVQDTGTGIAEEALPRLFSRFHRIQGAESRTHEGAGIGLALVQELVQLHAGSITVDTKYGQGTTFSILLPLGKAHLPQTHVTTAPLGGNAGVQPHSYAPAYFHWQPIMVEGKEEASPKQAVPTQLGKPQILAVDDNEDMLNYLQSILQDEYRVSTARNGAEAWELIQHSKPDLVVTDMMMPFMNGHELIKQIRSSYQTRTLPVILLSAKSGHEAQAEGMGMGADDYISKPFSSKELKARVASHLRLTRLRTQVESIVNGVHAGFAIINSQGCLSYANTRFLEAIGCAEQSVIGIEVESLLRNENLKALRQMVQKGLAKVETSSCELYSSNLCEWFEASILPSSEGIFILLHHITSRKENEQLVEKALHEANAQNMRLLDLNGRLEDFVRLAAHDLLSPANNLKRLLELQGEETLGASAQKIASLARAEAERLHKTILGLLDIIRVQEVSSQRIAEIHCSEVFKEVTEELRSLIEKQNALLRADFSLAPKVIYPDGYFRSILRNLLSNALKYADPYRRPVIEVTTRREGDMVVLQISDNGIGMDLRKNYDQLFKPFKRLHSKIEGNGLGLHVIKTIVERNGGGIEVQSQPGQGTTFLVKMVAYSKGA
ncbi:MAG: ATP-binding protein [Rufibacter sp.]